jgi:hypothetical protein
MELQCETCQTPLGDTPATQLLCGHRYHTQCFLHTLEVAILNENPQQTFCAVCHTHFFFVNDDQEEEEEEEVQYGPENNPETQTQDQPQRERQRVHTLWNTNPEFKKDLKTYMKSQRDMARPLRAFQTVLTTKKRELNEIYMPIKLRLEGIYNTKKDELMNTDECKAYRRALARCQRYYTLVHTKYTLTNSAFYYLREKRGCKRLKRYRHRWASAPQWMIRRAIRFRFRYY